MEVTALEANGTTLNNNPKKKSNFLFITFDETWIRHFNLESTNQEIANMLKVLNDQKLYSLKNICTYLYLG